MLAALLHQLPIVLLLLCHLLLTLLELLRCHLVELSLQPEKLHVWSFPSKTR